MKNDIVTFLYQLDFLIVSALSSKLGRGPIIEICWRELQTKALPNKYKGVKLSEIKTLNWGRECFLHDPSGILWHFGQFKEMA